MTGPRIPQLNLDWRKTQQQEAANSVQLGIDRISESINEVVKRKREEDAAYDNSIKEVIARTAGDRQKDLMEYIESSKEDLKSIGSSGWRNSKELIKKREEILNNVVSASQKANWLSANVPKLYEMINADPYADKSKSIARLQQELSKPLFSKYPASDPALDVGVIQSIYSNPEYKDMNAVMRDALNKTVGDRIYSTEPITKLEGDVYTTYNLQHKSNLVSRKDAKGNIELVPVYNVYGADGKLNEEETLQKKIEFADNVLANTGNSESVLKYYDDYFTAKNVPELRDVPQTAGEDRKKIVKQLIARYVVDTVGGADYKYLGTREKDNAVSKQLAILNLKNNFLKQQVNERAQEMYQLLGEAAGGEGSESARASLKNRIESTIKGTGDYVFAMSPDDGYYRMKNDKILTTKDLLEADQQEKNRYEKEKARKGDKAKPPSYYIDESGNLSDRAKRESVKPFTGIAYTRSKSSDPFDKEYSTFGFDWNDPKALAKFSVDWTNNTFNKNDATYNAVNSGTYGTGSSGFDGGRIF